LTPRRAEQHRRRTCLVGGIARQGLRPPYTMKLAVGRRNSQDLWIGVLRDLLITTF
jgi:hypothetical protein